MSSRKWADGGYERCVCVAEFGLDRWYPECVRCGALSCALRLDAVRWSGAGSIEPWAWPGQRLTSTGAGVATAGAWAAATWTDATGSWPAAAGSRSAPSALSEAEGDVDA